MNSNLLRWAVIAMVATFGIKVFAHARIKPVGTFVPRSTNPGIKVGPCGADAKNLNPPTYTPGQVINVQWEETIDHPGRYEFRFSTANDVFPAAAAMTIVDVQNAGVVLPHQYNANVTLPNVTCATCSLQLIQVMTETVPPSLYYACVDFKLAVAGTTPPPTPTPTPSPTPSPGPAPNCKAD